MEIQFLVDRHVAGATTQQLKAYLATMPHIGPTPVEVMSFSLG